MHDYVVADARWVLMWHVLIGYWCVILTCVKKYIKWSLVGHLYIVREDYSLIDHPIYLYFYDPLQFINFNSLNMQVWHIISCHVIFLYWKIFLKIKVAWHIIFLHWKIIQKIQENHLMPCHLSSLKNNSENSNSMPHHLMIHHLSLLKMILKIQENNLMPHNRSLLKNNFDNSRSTPHRLMTHHISPLKNNSKNSRKSPHLVTHFSIEK
jgi:hypothetical protein